MIKFQIISKYVNSVLYIIVLFYMCIMFQLHVEKKINYEISKEISNC
jgi:hypothetical protein